MTVLNKDKTIKVTLTQEEFDYWEKHCNGKDLGPNLRFLLVKTMRNAEK